jgi:hypothetical protein
MTLIDPRHAITAALREQLAALRERGRSHAPPAVATARAQRHAVAGTLAQRIAAIAPADPDRRRKAVRLFVEARIAAELGEQLRNDPGFPRMLDAIQSRMQADAQVAAAVESLGEWLVAGRASA